MTYEYHQPREIGEALDLLARHGDDAHLMAGGTAFVLLYRQGLLRPGHVVGLGGIGALRGTGLASDGTLVIGATTTHREAERSREVRQHCGALAHAFGLVGTVRIRNQATVGGNLAHADPAQDPPPILLALQARVVVRSVGGERRVALSDLFVDYLTTSLRPGEVITAIEVPPLASGTRASYDKFLPRTADDYATVSVAATLRLDAEGIVAEARVALGAVGPTPRRARAVEDALRGARPSASRVAEAAALVRDEIDPLDDLRGSAAYKREMARVWTERALRSLVEEQA